jgi:hypothetical protein
VSGGGACQLSLIKDCDEKMEHAAPFQAANQRGVNSSARASEKRKGRTRRSCNQYKTRVAGDLRDAITETDWRDDISEKWKS